MSNKTQPNLISTHSLIALLLFGLGMLLVGCVSSIDPSLPRDGLDRISLAMPYEAAASASDPASKLPLPAIPAGFEVEIVATDPSAIWLLVYDGVYLGWLPSFVSTTGIGRIEPPLVIEPLDGACMRYLGSTLDSAEAWTSSDEDPVVIQGSIYRPEAGPDFVDASLGIKISRSGEATAAEYVHTPLTTDASIVLFSFAVEGLQQGSKITFDYDDPSYEYVTFQASFFADKCATAWGEEGGRFVDWLPVGEVSTDLPEPKPTPRSREEPDAEEEQETVTQSTTIVVESGDRLEPPTQREIQALVDRWDRIHHEVDYTLDPTDLPLVLTGGALRQQEETLRSLRRTNCYWEFSDTAPSRITDWDEVSVNEVIVTMRKHWSADLYCNGRYDSKGSFYDPFNVRYQIIRTSEGWRIAEKVPLGE